MAIQNTLHVRFNVFAWKYKIVLTKLAGLFAWSFLHVNVEVVYVEHNGVTERRVGHPANQFLVSGSAARACNLSCDSFPRSGWAVDSTALCVRSNSACARWGQTLSSTSCQLK